MELEAFTGLAPNQRIRAWILAKLLWNPDLDVDALAHEYCDSVFGPAADEYYAYFEMIQAAGKAGKTIEDYYGRDKFLHKRNSALRKGVAKIGRKAGSITGIRTGLYFSAVCGVGQILHRLSCKPS